MNLHCWISAALASCLSTGALAQKGATDYPQKPVRIIVSQGIGGAIEAQTRLFANKIADNFGKPFVVDTRPGRDVAWLMVSRAAPDGYTLLAVAPDFTSAPALYAHPAVDPMRDFSPISMTSQAPFILSVQPTFSAKTVKEFIELARAQPGKLNVGGGLPGVGTHLVALWFFNQAKIQAAYVSYKGATQALVDLMGGQLHAAFSTGDAVAHIKAGRLRALGITMGHRSRLLPDIPTIAEQGLPGFDVSTFRGVAAPAKTPQPILDKLAMEFARVAKLPEIATALSADGSEPVGSSPEEFKKFIAIEVPRWRKVIQEAHIKLE